MGRRNSGNQDGKTSPVPADVNTANRERDVLELRIKGMEFEDIAREVGYSNASGAYKAYRRAIARIPAAQAQEARQEMNMRLNVALEAIWKGVKAGDNWSIDRMLAIEERRAKLLGLDAKADTAPPVVIVRELPKEVMDAI